MHRVADMHAQEQTRKEICIDKYKRRHEQILTDKQRYVCRDTYKRCKEIYAEKRTEMNRNGQR